VNDKNNSRYIDEQALDEFFKNLGAPLSNEEFIELTLRGFAPDADADTLARSLCTHFPIYADLVAAPVDRIRQIDGVTDEVAFALKFAHASALRFVRTQVRDLPVISSWLQLIDYCLLAVRQDEKEHFRVLYLDRGHALIADEIQQQGPIVRTHLYPREVIKRALVLDAMFLLLVHSHPRGSPIPTNSEIALTNELHETATRLGIILRDHVIIGPDGYTSFRKLELL
jgi:DNA repair protein RadC